MLKYSDTNLQMQLQSKCKVNHSQVGHLTSTTKLVNRRFSKSRIHFEPKKHQKSFISTVADHYWLSCVPLHA